jgi:hypothetical protein
LIAEVSCGKLVDTHAAEEVFLPHNHGGGSGASSIEFKTHHPFVTRAWPAMKKAAN